MTRTVAKRTVALAASIGALSTFGTGLGTSPAAAMASSSTSGATGPVPGTIFVANAGAGAGAITEFTGQGPGSVTLYRPGATGDARPEAVITQGVHGPLGIALDPSGDLWVANYGPNTLVEYKKSELAKADPAPAITISSSPDDALSGPAGLAFDTSGNLWVDNAGKDTVAEYTKAQLSVSGAPAPRVSITNRRLFAYSGPIGLAVDPSGDLWVQGSPSAITGAVCEYPRAQLANPGPPAPNATISPGYEFGFFTFDSSGNLWALEYYGHALAEYTKAELTKSGSPPVHITIGGPSISSPTGLAFDSSGDLWALNNGLDQTLVEYTKAELAKSGSPTPARTIQGAATGLNDPNYLVIEP